VDAKRVQNNCFKNRISDLEETPISIIINLLYDACENRKTLVSQVYAKLTGK
jgi:hypothetical protein